MIRTLFNGAAHLTVTGYLTVSFFKEAVLDPTNQLMDKAEKVSNLGVVASNFCLSTMNLLLASNKAAPQFLSSDIKQKPAPMHDSAEPNLFLTGDDIAEMISSLLAPQPFDSSSATEAAASPVTCTTPCFSSPIQKPKPSPTPSFQTTSDDVFFPDPTWSWIRNPPPLNSCNSLLLSFDLRGPAGESSTPASSTVPYDPVLYSHVVEGQSRTCLRTEVFDIRGPLRLNTDDASSTLRPPSLSPTTGSSTTHEVEGHRRGPAHTSTLGPSCFFRYVEVT
ncbi:uncharacterized protein EDB91DRAFT_1245842 [Suillus paluster]|uniref:uncharacterized protein n=1 Tax=Suillus paluster TaxID=48578 RepID=UPI001B874A77|nr:uncharacterized protein EDB91DRAFT_1245842 [Suillus paluster]KAG1746655.1 hypothetical protein EDB91DRAFT_1245842 [Suillus paluster]